METFITQFNWQGILVIALVVSFVVEALNRVTPSEISSKLLLFVISFLVTVLKVEFDFSSWTAIRLVLFDTLLTMSVAILFYTYLGKWVVEKIFDTIKKRSESKLND